MTRLTALDTVPLRFLTETPRLPACKTSVLVMGAEQELLFAQLVICALPPTSSVEPDPPPLATNPLPSTRSVNPFVPPA